MNNRFMKNISLTKARIYHRGIGYTVRALVNQARMFLEHSTTKKFVNYLLIKGQKLSRRAQVRGLPYNYVIDPMNVCNLRCPLCPTGLGILGRERGKMTLEQYQSLIDQVAAYAYSIELYNWGEPFLHPQIFDMIRYASQRKIFVQTSSNMNRFSRDMAKKAVASGLDYLIVSLDGATQETYEKYRKGGKISDVIENVNMLVEEKRQARSRKPFINLRMIVNRHNEGEIDQIRKLAGEMGVDTCSFLPIFIDTTEPKMVEEWLPINEDLSYYDHSSNNLENVWHCSDLWERMVINWDGNVAPCCWLHQKDHDFDSAFNNPIAEIWNSDAYKSSRLVFAPGGPKDGPQKTICTVCKGRPLYLKD